MGTREWRIRRPEDIGAALGELRRSRGLTQQQLAAEIQVQRAFLAAMEGGRSNRLIDHFLRALRRLGAEVTVTWVTDDDE